MRLHVCYYLALLLTGCSVPQPTNLALRPYDGGGDFVSRLISVKAAAALQKNVALRGGCMSSCAAELGAGANVCVAPDALIGVHEVRRVPKWLPGPSWLQYELGARNDDLTKIFMETVPACARALFLAKGGWQSGDIVSVRGFEILVACPQIRACT